MSSPTPSPDAASPLEQATACVLTAVSDERLADAETEAAMEELAAWMHQYARPGLRKFLPLAIQRLRAGDLFTEECYFGPPDECWPDGWASSWSILAYFPSRLPGDPYGRTA